MCFTDRFLCGDGVTASPNISLLGVLFIIARNMPIISVMALALRALLAMAYANRLLSVYCPPLQHIPLDRQLLQVTDPALLWTTLSTASRQIIGQRLGAFWRCWR